MMKPRDPILEALTLGLSFRARTPSGDPLTIAPARMYRHHKRGTIIDYCVSQASVGELHTSSNIKDIAKTAIKLCGTQAVDEAARIAVSHFMSLQAKDKAS